MKHTASVTAMHPPVCGTSIQELEAFLRETVSGLQEEEEESSGGPGRPRELAGNCLWVGLLVCLLRGLHSQKAIWRVLSLARLWGFAQCLLTPQAVYKRLDEAGSAPMEQFFAQISRRLLRRVEALLARGEREGTFTRLAPFAADIVVLDETILDHVARRLPLLRGVARGSLLLLPGKLVSLFSVRTRQWRRIHFEPDSTQNEKVSARLLLSGLASGTLLLFDLGYSCFKWFDDLTDAGFWYVSRLRERSAIQVLHRFYEQGETFDGLVFLGTRKGARPRHAVRLICFVHQGILHRYITNVRDPLQLSMQDIARLYARRWDIECAFLLLKRHLGLAFLWSAKPHVLLQQVWGTLILAQLLQALRLQIAVQARQDPFDVSMELLIAYLPTLSQYPEGGLGLLLARGHELGFLRPSSRIRIQTPEVSALLLLSVPLALILEQVPNYPPDPGKTRKRSPKKRDKKRSSGRKRR
jgi:Transposase DDE domain